MAKLDNSFITGSFIVELTSPNGASARIDAKPEEVPAVKELIKEFGLDVGTWGIAPELFEKPRSANASPATGPLATENLSPPSQPSNALADLPVGMEAACRKYLAEAGLKASTLQTYSSRLKLAQKFFEPQLVGKTVLAIGQPSFYQYVKHVC